MVKHALLAHESVYYFEATLVWTLPHLKQPSRWLGLITVECSSLYQARQIARAQVAKKRLYQVAIAEDGWKLLLRGRILRGRRPPLYPE